MNKRQTQHVFLGIMVLAGTLVLVLGLYFIGSNQNLFGNNIRLKVEFRNVNGLMAGNNVRFSGIDIGTVEKVELFSDSTVSATLLIEKEASGFIRKNSLAAIGTDGLMGNKLVNIGAGEGVSEAVKNGDMIASVNPIETDEMFRTLNRTNEDIAVIVKNLRNITDKVNSSNTIWSLLLDPEVARNVKFALQNVQRSSERTVGAATDLAQIVRDVQEGKGIIGALVKDPDMGAQLKQTILRLGQLSDSLVMMSAELGKMSKAMNRSDNAVAVLSRDTAFASHLQTTMSNLEAGTRNFNDNMEALKQNSLMKKYFRRLEQGKKK